MDDSHSRDDGSRTHDMGDDSRKRNTDDDIRTHNTDDDSRNSRRTHRSMRAYTFSGGRPRH